MGIKKHVSMYDLQRSYTSSHQVILLGLHLPGRTWVAYTGPGWLLTLCPPASFLLN